MFKWMWNDAGWKSNQKRKNPFKINQQAKKWHNDDWMSNIIHDDDNEDIWLEMKEKRKIARIFLVDSKMIFFSRLKKIQCNAMKHLNDDLSIGQWMAYIWSFWLNFFSHKNRKHTHIPWLMDCRTNKKNRIQ